MFNLLASIWLFVVAGVFVVSGALAIGNHVPVWAAATSAACGCIVGGVLIWLLSFVTVQ